MPDSSLSSASWLRPFRRARRVVLAHRRGLAALLAGLAVLVGVQAASEPAEPAGSVLVARADLAAGGRLDPGDVEILSMPLASLPDGATADPEDVVGRVLASPLRRHEPVTDARLVSPRLLAGYPGRVAVPVRVADADTVRLLRVGDRIDLVATDPDTGRAETAARAAPVVALPRGGSDGLTGGALVMVAVSEAEAIHLAGQAASKIISVILSA